MSRYTTELRFMLETQAGLEGAGAASDVNTVINSTRTWLFDFDYPSTVLTEDEKAHLEKNFMLQYYTREIGFETFGLFKQKLQAKLWLIMPKYEKLYALEHRDLDYFNDVDYSKRLDGTLEQDGTVNKRSGNVEHANSGTQTNTTTGGYTDANSGTLTDVSTGKVKETTGGTDTKTTTGGYTDTKGGNDTVIFSDTPQSTVDIPLTNGYATTVTKTVNGGTLGRSFSNYQEANQAGQYKETEYQNQQNQSTDLRQTQRTYNSLQTQDTNLKKLTDTFNNLLDEIDKTDTKHDLERVWGNMGGNIDKLIKYRDNVLNLERMIIEECSDLFMLLWI